MSEVFYAFVGRGTVILAEYTEFNGNFVWFVRFSLLLGVVWLLRKCGNGKKGEVYVFVMPTPSFPTPTMVGMRLFPSFVYVSFSLLLASEFLF